MSSLFAELLNMSIVSSLLIVAVILIRLVLKKAPKAIICVLWAMVGIRLICPISVESPLSVVPDSRPVSYISEYFDEDAPENSGSAADKSLAVYEKSDSSDISADSNAVIYEQSLSTAEEAVEVDFAEVILSLLPYIWAGGAVVMTALSVISYVRLRRSMLICVNYSGNVWRCDGIKSPFIMGLIRPRIYVPSHLEGEELDVVIAHEKAHLRRLDHVWKPLGYLILTIHWFNPLVWVAYALLCKDIEGACDQRVVSKMNAEDKKLYSVTLLSCSAPRHMLTACPVAFGEVNVRQRVRSVLDYKKPAFRIVMAAVALCIVVAVIFMTNPISIINHSYSTEYELIRETILSENENDLTENYFACESHEVLKRTDYGDSFSYYLLVLYSEYTCDGTAVNAEGASEYYPCVISCDMLSDGKLEVTEYWKPQQGELYTDSVKSKFPATLQNKVLYGKSYSDTLRRNCDDQAYAYFGIEKTVTANGNYPRFSGEVISVSDDEYLLAPLEGNTIFGEQYDRVYVSRNASYGGDTEYNTGDVLTVTYRDGTEDSDPLRLGNIDSISLTQKVQDRIKTYKAELSRYYEDGEIFSYLFIDADAAQLENLEVYCYLEDVPTDGAGGIIDSSNIIFDGFVPYLVLDHSTGFSTFAYSKSYTLKGTFEVSGDKLTLKSVHDGLYLTSDQTPESYTAYVFNKTGNGYAFDVENSAPINTYYEDLSTGEIKNSLPQDSVFVSDFTLVSFEFYE